MSTHHRLGSGLEAIPLFALLVVRGWLLWLAIPLAFLGWLVMSPIRVVLSKPYIALGKLIGWVDMNLTAAIGKALVRPFGRRISLRRPKSHRLSTGFRSSTHGE